MRVKQLIAVRYTRLIAVGGTRTMAINQIRFTPGAETETECLAANANIEKLEFAQNNYRKLNQDEKMNRLFYSHSIVHICIICSCTHHTQSVGSLRRGHTHCVIIVILCIERFSNSNNDNNNWKWTVQLNAGRNKARTFNGTIQRINASP